MEFDPGQCWHCEKVIADVAETVQTCLECNLAEYCSTRCLKEDKLRHFPVCNLASPKKPCGACRKNLEDPKKCSACQKSHYCNEQCQLKHWPRHKGDCKQTRSQNEEKIKNMAEMMMVRKKQRDPLTGIFMPTVYFIGNYPAYDMLNLKRNEGITYDKPFDLLFCAVGDLRNVFMTLKGLPEHGTQDVSIWLNDIESQILARNLLFLFLLLRGGKDVIEDIVMLWYSVIVPYSTMLRLREALQELISTRAKECFERLAIMVTDEDIKRLQHVWQKWLEFAKDDTSWIIKSYAERNRDVHYETGMPQYIATIAKDKQKSMKKWCQTGKFQRATSKSEEPGFGNPTFAGNTFFDRSKYEYHPRDNSIMPFVGWDYKKVVTLYDSSSITDMFFRYICHIIQNAYVNISRRNVTFHIHVCDIIHLPDRLSSSVKFDRIHMSNVADYIYYVTLLDIFADYLKVENDYSAIIMEFQNWFSDNFYDVRLEAEASCGIRRNELEKKTSQGLKLTKGQVSAMQRNHLRDFNEAIDEKFPLFLQFARLACENHSAYADVHTRKFKSVDIFKYQRLKLRNFTRNGNQISPFKLLVNNRCPSKIIGFERVIEWTLEKQTCQHK